MLEWATAANQPQQGRDTAICYFLEAPREGMDNSECNDGLAEDVTEGEQLRWWSTRERHASAKSNSVFVVISMIHL
jgi:hypothetical protein